MPQKIRCGAKKKAGNPLSRYERPKELAYAFCYSFDSATSGVQFRMESCGVYVPTFNVSRFCALLCRIFRKRLDFLNLPTGRKRAENPRNLEFSTHFGVPERIRTAGLSLRRRTLYPAELRRHNVIIVTFSRKSVNEGNTAVAGIWAEIKKYNKNTRKFNFNLEKQMKWAYNTILYVK